MNDEEEYTPTYKTEQEWLNCPIRAALIKELCGKIPGLQELVDRKNKGAKLRVKPKTSDLSAWPFEER